MTVQGYVMEKESPVTELAMALVGDFKSGKSYTAATAPGNILFLDMDRRLKSLAAHPNAANIFGLEFLESSSAAASAVTAKGQQTAAQAALGNRDQAGATKAPQAFNDMLEIVNKLEVTPFLRELHETFADAGERMVDTVVFDSIQSISNAARDYVTFVAPELAKTITLGKRQYRVASSWNAWGSEEMMVTSMILQARAIRHCRRCAKPLIVRKNADEVSILAHVDPKITDHVPEARGLNVICTLHECAERDETSTEENPVYTGKIEVFPRRYNKLLMYFNEVWRVTRVEGRLPTIQFDPNNKFVQAATALGLPDMTKLAPEQRSDMAAILRLARNGRPTQTQTQAEKEISKNATNQNPERSPGAPSAVRTGSDSSSNAGVQAGTQQERG